MRRAAGSGGECKVRALTKGLVPVDAHPQDHTKLFVRARMAKLKWNISYCGDGR
jgi:hypothetical protein